MSSSRAGEQAEAGAFLSLELILEPAVLQPESWSRIREGLRAMKLVVIRDAIKPDYAEKVHAALDGSRSWKAYEGANKDFHFRHHNIYTGGAFPPIVNQCRALFSSTRTKSLISELSNRDCSAATTCTASWYMPSDYSLPHEDCSTTEPLRQVAFLWHLTKNWEREWGGHLYWGPTQELLPPSFNTLMLFAIRPDGMHFVAPVALKAGGKRLAITGWWNGATPYPARNGRPRTADRIEIH